MEYNVRTASFICIFATLATMAGLTYWYWFDPLYHVFTFISGIPLLMTYGAVYGFVAELFGFEAVEMHEEGEEEQEELSYTPIDTTEYDVVTSEKIVGKFMDANIYEYLMNGGEKFWYYNVLHPSEFENFHAPEGSSFLLVQPGILYVTAPPDFEPEPENTAA
jgi:hypothetical protein